METKMMTKTRRDLLEEIETKIRDIMYEDCRNGANDYAYVRVSVDGSVYSGREAGYCVTESEYFGRRPHPITVWSECGMREPAGPDDGCFAWDELRDIPKGVHFWTDRGSVFIGNPDTDDKIEEVSGFVRRRTIYELSDRLVESFDLTGLMSEIDDRLDEYEWLPVR